MGMELGAVYPQAEIGNDPGFIRHFAQSVEEAGYGYLTAFDHILGAEASRFDGPVGGFPSPPYLIDDPFHEVFSLFSFLAGVTERLIFRPRVLILPQRDAVLAAKQAATLDRLSGSRLVLGVGVGWNFAEYQGVGAAFTNRGQRIEEQITLMRRLWSEHTVTFDGRFHQLDRVGINPRPASGSVPLWIGSGGQERSLRRVATMGDGWIALLTPQEDLGAAVARLKELRAEAGHDPAEQKVEILTGVGSGTPDQWQAKLSELAAQGATHVCLASGRGTGKTPGQHLEVLLKAKAELGGVL
jgi:probable F420-dependent oxidoreductase